MGPVLQEILKTGFADGISVPLRSQITIGEGDFLQSIIKEIQPHVCLEVGLAFGISALYIREVLDPRCRYIAIDPFQHHDWHGIGLSNLRRAGYEVEFYEEASQATLPRLWANGLTIDFALIDGMHTFDLLSAHPGYDIVRRMRSVSLSDSLSRPRTTFRSC